MKRLISLFLALMMACSISVVPAGAFGAHPFRDVPDDHWAALGVQYVYENGIMNGLSGDTFGPETPFTRAMFVTILGRSEGVDPQDYPGVPFSDVSGPQWEWAAPYIQWASDMGIVNGVGDGLFAPESIITREQYCTIIIRYMDAVGLDFLGVPPLAPAFCDGYDIQPYALPHVMHLASYGLIDSFGGYVYPSDPMNRGNIANLFTLFHQMKTMGIMPDVYSYRTNPNITYSEVASLLVETSVFTWDWFYGGLYLDRADSFEVYLPDYGMDVPFARVNYPAVGSYADVEEMGRKHYDREAWETLAGAQMWRETSEGLYLPDLTKDSPYDLMDSCALDIQRIDEMTFAVTIIPYYGNEELGRVYTSCIYWDGYWTFADPVPVYLDLVPLAFG